MLARRRKRTSRGRIRGPPPNINGPPIRPACCISSLGTPVTSTIATQEFLLSRALLGKEKAGVLLRQAWDEKDFGCCSAELLIL